MSGTVTLGKVSPEKNQWIARVLNVSLSGGDGPAGPVRKRVNELRSNTPRLAAAWDLLPIADAEKQVAQFNQGIDRLGKDGKSEFATDRALEADIKTLSRFGEDYADRVAGDRTTFEVVARTADEIVNIIPGLKKPRDLIDGVGFCRSSLAGIERAAQRQPARPDFASLGERVAELRDGLASAEQRAKGQMLANLRQPVKDAAEWASSFAMKATDIETRGLTPEEQTDLKSRYYKEASQRLNAEMQELGDWGRQIRESQDWLGQDAGKMEALIVEWTEHCIGIRDAMEKFLPTLRSKISSTPPGEGENDGQALDDPEKTLTVECKKSWVEAKKLYATKPKAMQSLANWRKKVVDEYLNTTFEPFGVFKGPDKGWVSVGSADPTSDYDISINKHGKKEDTGEVIFDYEMVRMFNQYWNGKYGVETGTLFDTNLYAAAPPMVKLQPREDATPQELEAQKDADNAMDVGALMKLRRYMSASDFAIYRANTLETYTDPGKRRAVEKQFAEADANYLVSLSTIIEKVEALLDKELPKGVELPESLLEERAEARHLIDEWNKKKDSYTGIRLQQGQVEMENLAHKLEHMNDLNLTATNEIYVDQIGKLRQAEADVLKLNKLRDDIDALDPSEDPEQLGKKLESLRQTLAEMGMKPDILPTIEDPNYKASLEALAQPDSTGKAAMSDASVSMLGNLTREKAMAMFFANEAYQSAGPFKAVVEADQAVGPDVKAKFAEEYYSTGDGRDQADAFKKADADTRDKMIAAAWQAKYQEAKEQNGKTVWVDTPAGAELIKAERQKRRDAISPEEVLQSFNEQLGDFLKDLAHYGDQEPGKAIIQSSKYLDRLLEALVLMQKDKGLSCVAETSELGKLVKEQIALQPLIKKELIGARKGLIKMDPLAEGDTVDQDKERKAYACDFMKRHLGVVSVSELATLYSRLGTQVNTAVRKELAG